MKTATQFAEEVRTLSASLGGEPAAPAVGGNVAEEIADWRGPLQEIQVRLRRMIQGDIDKFMESAQKIVQRAEESDWSKTVVQNEVARWSADVNKVYADFKNATQGFMDLVKSMGVTTRRHSTKGKAPSARGKMDWSSLAQPQLKKEVHNQVQRLSGGIHSLADDGAYMLHQIDRILKYKAPNDETIREEIGALYQDFVDFRDAFGSKVWGPYNGLIGRLNAIPAKPVGKYGKEYAKAMRTKPSRMVASSDLPIDCPELREAIERDRMRATRGVLGEDRNEAQALIEGIEAELLGEAAAEDKPEEGVAKKMKAKGYGFKVLLKDKPPLYTKTEKGAKEVQKDYPGSKIVKNESGEIDDQAVIEAAEHGDLFDFFEDFGMFGGSPFLGEGKLLDPEQMVKKMGRGWFIMKNPDGSDNKVEMGSYSTKNAAIEQAWAMIGSYAGRNKVPLPKGAPPRAVSAHAAYSEGDDPVGDELTEMSEVVKTIFQQMGGGRGLSMIGGQAMAIDGNTLGIKWPSRHRARIGNYVEVKYLPGADLYDMEFFNISPQGKKTVKKFTRLYGDQLIPTFEDHTAWYIRL